MRLIRITTICVLLSAVALRASSQKMIILEADPSFGWGNSSMGSFGYDIELRGHNESLGIKLAYANSYTNESDVKNYYKYFNVSKATASWRFAHRKNDYNDMLQDEFAHLLNIGYNRITAYKHQVFDAVDTTLKPPENNPAETQRLLDVYGTNVRFTSGFISIGYERLKKSYSKSSGKYSVNRMVNGVLTPSEAHGGLSFYTSSLYFDLLFLAPGGLQYTPRLATQIHGVVPPSTPVMETMYKNYLGFRMGYEISMIRKFGFNIGIETGIMPGIFHHSSVYGNGFPQDNLYFSGKVGFSFGKASHPKTGLKK